jgi:hypothetical protein
MDDRYRFDLEPSARHAGRFNYWIGRSDRPNWGERSMSSFASPEEAARAAMARIEFLLKLAP